jgi:hypothetical protein
MAGRGKKVVPKPFSLSISGVQVLRLSYAQMSRLQQTGKPSRKVTEGREKGAEGGKKEDGHLPEGAKLSSMVTGYTHED